MLLADPPVDAGRLNVTHIIIHHHGELGKEGRDRRAGVKERGGQGRTSCPGQLKSLQPPPLDLFNISDPDQKTSTFPQQ